MKRSTLWNVLPKVYEDKRITATVDACISYYLKNRERPFLEHKLFEFAHVPLPFAVQVTNANSLQLWLHNNISQVNRHKMKQMIVWVPFCFGPCFLTRGCPLSSWTSASLWRNRVHSMSSSTSWPTSSWKPTRMTRRRCCWCKESRYVCRHFHQGITPLEKRISAGHGWKLDYYCCKVGQVNDIKDESYFSSVHRQVREASSCWEIYCWMNLLPLSPFVCLFLVYSSVAVQNVWLRRAAILIGTMQTSPLVAPGSFWTW